MIGTEAGKLSGHMMYEPRLWLNLWRAVQLCVFLLINSLVPEPYMDEVFHIPQAQAYCRDEFWQYDPKLTTPPGLYFVFRALHQIGVPCSIGYLRLVNLVVGVVLLPRLFSQIQRQRNPAATTRADAWAHCIAIMPLFSFFSLLFYTDMISTYLVLLSYSFCLQNELLWSSVVGFLSLWFRQTNFIWTCVFGAIGLVERLKSQRLSAIPEKSLENAGLIDVIQLIFALFRNLLSQTATAMNVVLIFSPSVVLATMFLAWNRSIVLGDKSMHQAGIYPIQMFYMVGFASIVSWPVFIQRDTLRSVVNMYKRPMTCVAIVVCAVIASRYKSIQHPFILSDNRHFPFYINKRIVQQLPSAILSSFFIASITLFISRIGHVPVSRVMLLAAATICTLVPTSLLEFRYYLIPYLLWRLETGAQLDNRLKMLETSGWILVHVGTIYLFLFRPFHWADSDSIQRFMW